MKRKIILALVLILIVAVGIYALLTRGEKTQSNEVALAVEVEEAKVSKSDKYITYFGAIQSSSIEKISFKSSARLAELNGKAGEILKAGTEFIKLDTSDLELELKASEEQLAGAKSQYADVSSGARSEDISMLENQLAKAGEQVEYLQKLYDDTSALLESGFASKKDVDDILVRLNVAKNDLSSAKANLAKARSGASGDQLGMAASQVALAETSVEGKKSLIEDASYIVDDEKIVVDTMFKVGELVPAGYVVAVVRDAGKKLIIAVTAFDLDLIELGKEVILIDGERELKGKISKIKDVPEEETMLYNIEIDIKEDAFKLGEIVKCKIKVGELEGIRIPMNAVLRDKIDYVYVVSDEFKVKIKPVEVLDEEDGLFLVKGLVEGDKVVVEGYNKISENDKVSVHEMLEE